MRRYWWLVAVAVAAALLAGGVTYGVSQWGKATSDSELERAYRAGVDALARGDYQRAGEQLGRAAAIDPTYRDVAKLLADAQAAGSPGPQTTPRDSTPDATGSTPATKPAGSSGSSSKPPTVKPGQPGFKRPADLSTLVPNPLPGYNPPQIDKAKDLVTAVYVPLRTGNLRQVQITITDRKTSAKAVGFVNTTLRGVYSRDAATVSVGSGITAYFGTSQRLYATVGWSKGTLAFQVLGEVDQGEPVQLKGRLVDIAKKVG